MQFISLGFRRRLGQMGNALRSYYQYLTLKGSDIISKDGGYVMENKGTGGEIVDAPILNTQIATFDGTASLQSDYDLDLWGITITAFTGTSTPTISGFNINFTAGTFEHMLLSNGDEYYVQEGVGIVLHSNGKPLNLFTRVDGDGTITPASGTYDDGDIVEIVAEPIDPLVTELSDITVNTVSVGNTSPYSLLMDSAKNVVAYFLSLNPFLEYDEQFIPDTGNYVMRDLFEGTEIDLSKWLIINPNPTIVSFSQNNTLRIKNEGAGAVGFFANNIKSIDTISTGVIKFAISFSDVGGNTTFGMCGSDADRSQFYLNGNTIDYRIYQSNVLKYGAITVASYINSMSFKFVIQAGNIITPYYWDGSQWVIIGVAQTYNLGSNLKFFMSMTGASSLSSYMDADDVFITNNDFNTLNP